MKLLKLILSKALLTRDTTKPNNSAQNNKKTGHKAHKKTPKSYKILFLGANC